MRRDARHPGGTVDAAPADVGSVPARAVALGSPDGSERACGDWEDDSVSRAGAEELTLRTTAARAVVAASASMV
jgi:hypothetical protein